MKKAIGIFNVSILMMLSLTACNNGGNTKAVETDKPKTVIEVVNAPVQTSTASISEIVKNYLALKNALTADKTNEAAAAGKALEATIKSFNKTALTEAQKKVFADVEDDAREHAEHIGANGGNIEHQREHFDTLSKDIYALVKAFGAGQTLYQDFCPMYNDKKGATWLSETKDINNPYYGKKMSSCGTMKEELK